jgi:hypothetical protein
MSGDNAGHARRLGELSNCVADVLAESPESSARIGVNLLTTIFCSFKRVKRKILGSVPDNRFQNPAKTRTRREEAPMTLGRNTAQWRVQCLMKSWGFAFMNSQRVGKVATGMKQARHFPGALDVAGQPETNLPQVPQVHPKNLGQRKANKHAMPQVPQVAPSEKAIA